MGYFAVPEFLFMHALQKLISVSLTLKIIDKKVVICVKEDTIGKERIQ